MSRAKIKLKNWVNGNCLYQGCKYNTYGACEYDDSEFIDNILEIVDKNGVDNEIHFDCNAIEIPDGICEFCSNELSVTTQMVPYGSTIAPYQFYECKNKDC